MSEAAGSSETSVQLYYTPWHQKKTAILILYTICSGSQNHVSWHDGVSLLQKQLVISSISLKRPILWTNHSVSFNVSE